MTDTIATLPSTGQSLDTGIATAPWYATDLSRWDGEHAPGSDDQEPQEPHHHHDLIIEHKAYRRLTPAYYAWLRSRMTYAQQKQRQGLLPDAIYDPLRQRFNAMQDAAVHCYGEAALLEALGTLDLSTYEPPSVRHTSGFQTLWQDAQSQSAGSPPLAVLQETRPTGAQRDTPPAAAAHAPPGPRVQDRGGHWTGQIVRQHPADEWFPHGWVDIITDDGRVGQADVRGLLDAEGQPLVAEPRYTLDEQQIIALARDGKPEDYERLEASLPILAFAVPGDWRFDEKPSLDDYLQVNDIREHAHAMGWTDADLFQTCGRFKFPCGQDYGLVCFLHGRTIGAVTAETIELQPEKSDGVPLRFARPRRADRPEAYHGPIRETLSECGATPAQATAGGVTTLRRRKNAVRAVSGHATGLQPAARAGLAHAGLFAEPNCLPNRTV